MSTPNTQPKLRVAVVGGGIGGLTAALALSKYQDIEVTVYESAAFFSEVGAGIGIWPRIWKTLGKLGLTEDLAKATHIESKPGKVDAFVFRKSDQQDGHEYYKLETDGSFATYYRPDLQNVLISHLPPSVKILYKKRLSSYRQITSSTHSQVFLAFEDGTSATTDLLVGCDGIKSTVRRTLLHEEAKEAFEHGDLKLADKLLSSVDPKWLGIVAYRALIPIEKLKAYKETEQGKNVRVPHKDSVPTVYQGQNTSVVVYPVSRGTVINVGAFHSRPDLVGAKWPVDWVAKVDKAELLKAHEHWEPELRAIMDCVETPTRWAIHAAVPLDNWVSGNVCLLGDAAHAMSPQQGSGAGQAVEDAYVLATILGHHLTTKASIGRALKIYDAIRRPAANEVAQRSFTNGHLFGLQLPNGPNVDQAARANLFSDSYYQHTSKLGLSADTTSSCGPIDFTQPIDMDNVVDFNNRENQTRLRENGTAIRENWRWAWETTLDHDVNRAVAELKRQAAQEDDKSVLESEPVRAHL